MKLIERHELLERLIDLRGTPDIKIITGVRRSGKSQLMRSYIERIRTAEPETNIIVIDFVDLAFEPLILVAGMYYVLVMLLAMFAKRLERRLRKSDRN